MFESLLGGFFGAGLTASSDSAQQRALFQQQQMELLRHAQADWLRQQRAKPENDYIDAEFTEIDPAPQITETKLLTGPSDGATE